MSAVADRLHTFSGVSFGGVPCAQMFADFYVWEGVLNDQPQLRGIVEIGTFQGGFSLYLSSQARLRGLDFRTYDVVKPERRIPGFVQLDVFAHADAVAAHLRRHGPLILLCDGGNKPRELSTFWRYLSSESVIAVHDWGDEISDDDVPPELEMLYEDYCLDLGSATRFFKRADV